MMQRTLAASLSLSGVGLHSGEQVELTLLPAAEDHGIVFERVDDVVSRTDQVEHDQDLLQNVGFHAPDEEVTFIAVLEPGAEAVDDRAGQSQQEHGEEDHEASALPVHEHDDNAKNVEENDPQAEDLHAAHDRDVEAASVVPQPLLPLLGSAELLLEPEHNYGQVYYNN